MNHSALRKNSDAESGTINPLCRVASEALSLTPRPPQIDAAKSLLDGALVEMKTGEGKTLSIALAASELASRGHRVFVATANDYLAQRDCEWMLPLYKSMQQVAGFAAPGSSELSRCKAYAADITYGTLRQFAFDYLRDQSARRRDPGAGVAVKTLDTIILDEADSLLIDEARTPMVIHESGESLSDTTEMCFRWAAGFVSGFTPEDYVLNLGRVALTKSGRSKFFRATIPQKLRSLSSTQLQHAIERAIQVRDTLVVNQHYIVRGDRVELVDEYTGRSSEQRSFGGGIQQAIEAQAGVVLSPPTQPIARVSVQDFVMLFANRSGMTATAWQDKDELKRVYGLDVVPIHPYKESQFTMHPPVGCSSGEEKLQRICSDIARLVSMKRPVLVGTRTVKESERIHSRLTNTGIANVVLNARQDVNEAQIVAKAGRAGTVTVATNMAGRGTDIPIDDSSRAAGGLHVIVCEMNSSRRIDAQLIGRCARQGDPGSAQIYVSPDDQNFQVTFDAAKIKRLRTLSDARLCKKALSVQKRIEQLHRRQRSQLTAHEAAITTALQELGLDPHLDVLPESIE